MSAKDLYPHLWLTPFIHYPNINNVTDAIDDEGRRRVLDSLARPPGRPRKGLVYVHIPFCTSHCTFCFYNIQLAKEGNPIVAQYVDALIAEIELYASRAHVQGLQFEHVFMGGGTPSVLPAPLIERLVTAIRKAFFPNGEPQEYSMEFALQTMTEDRLRACRAAGVTRISFGWQTFAPAARKAAGLVPTEETLKQCSALLRAHGYAVNTDLIYGLPEQTRQDWADDLARAVDYGFDGIDTFAIQPVPPSPLYSLIRQQKLSVPTSPELLDMLGMAVAALPPAGYVRSNFQRFHKPEVPTSQHRYNNAMFSTEHDVVALGAGAIGMLRDRVYMNVRGLDEYLNWRAASSSPMSCAAEMDDAKWVERAFCLQLPWLSRVRKDALRAPITEAQRRTLAELAAHGLLEETAEEYRLLPAADGYNFNIARSFVSLENRARNEDYAQSLMKEINWRPAKRPVERV